MNIQRLVKLFFIVFLCNKVITGLSLVCTPIIQESLSLCVENYEIVNIVFIPETENRGVYAM